MHLKALYIIYLHALGHLQNSAPPALRISYDTALPDFSAFLYRDVTSLQILILLGTYGHYAASVLFFSVPHLLWNGASVYNEHLRGPVTLTPIIECLAVELTFLRLQFIAVGIRTLNLQLALARCAIASVTQVRICPRCLCLS